MKQISLAQSGFEIAKKTTRKRKFLEEMNKVVPWRALVALVESHAPPADRGRQGGAPVVFGGDDVTDTLHPTMVCYGW